MNERRIEKISSKKSDAGKDFGRAPQPRRLLLYDTTPAPEPDFAVVTSTVISGACGSANPESFCWESGAVTSRFPDVQLHI
jgi:hypothetical protein